MQLGTRVMHFKLRGGNLESLVLFLQEIMKTKMNRISDPMGVRYTIHFEMIMGSRHWGADSRDLVLGT